MSSFRHFTRRSFLQSLPALAALTAFPNPGKRLEGKNWIWIHPGTTRSDEEWKRLFDRLRNAGIQGVLAEVFNGEHSLFAHPYLKVRGRILERLIPLARAAGLELHAWIWTLNINDPAPAAAHPDWYAVNRLGQPAHTHPAYVPHYRFLCPQREEVRLWVRDTVAFLAAIPGLQGIHLDYVRMPDAILAKGLWAKYGIVQDREYPPYDYCYCAHCRQLFRSRTGIDPLADLSDPSADAAWRQFRYDAVSSLVNDYLAPAARLGGKLITAAVFPHWRHVRQEWPRWNLDGFFPMLYHSFYEEDLPWIGRQTRLAVDRLQHAAPVYAGLFLPALSPPQLREAIALARANGAAGISLFSLKALSEAHWRMIGG